MDKNCKTLSTCYPDIIIYERVIKLTSDTSFSIRKRYQRLAVYGMIERAN